MSAQAGHDALPANRIAMRGDLSQLIWSDMSPEEGHPMCICSACWSPIGDGQQAMRMFDDDTGRECRFCDPCAEMWVLNRPIDMIDVTSFQSPERELIPAGLMDVGEIVARGLNDRWRIMSYRDDVTAELKLLKRGGIELPEEAIIYDLIDNYRRAEL